MSYAIELCVDDYFVSGWGGFRSQKEAEKHLPELADYARRDAAISGIPLSAYAIGVINHARDCPGQCPDELGLAPGCRDVAEYIIEPK